jgi:hypothetical protein
MYTVLLAGWVDAMAFWPHKLVVRLSLLPKMLGEALAACVLLRGQLQLVVNLWHSVTRLQ